MSGNIFRKIPRWMLLYYALGITWLGTVAMHIPDGYLSPVVCIILIALTLPFWIRGVQKLREKLNAKNIPLVALFAAFSFVIMMFNIPLPGGTTGHAVGGALAAIILGPEIACIAISIALIIQAFFFGDGGILAIGANCFNMAVVLPYVSYAIYQWISNKSDLKSSRRVLAALISGYAGLAVAAFFTAVEFGIQPALFHTAEGTPLYAPYPLSVAIPAMMIPHLLVAAVVEGVVTALVVAYLVKANPSALNIFAVEKAEIEPARARSWRPLWIALIVLVIISPLGLLAPGTAWGEWGAEELTSLGLTFIPQGLQQFSNLWSAPMPDYEIKALGSPSTAYILSAAVGILITIVVVWLFSFLVTRRK